MMAYQTKVMNNIKFEEYRNSLMEHLQCVVEIYSLLEAEVQGTYKAVEYREQMDKAHLLLGDVMQMRYPKKAVDKKRELERDKMHSPGTWL